MTAGRIASLFVGLFVAATLWWFLNDAKNDVVTLNRSLIGQIKAAYKKFDEASDKLEAGDRLARVQARFFIKYHFPEGNPDRLQTMMEGLFDHFDRCDPESVMYGEDDKPRKTEDGREHNHRQVVMQGRQRDGSAMTLTVEWVQFKGSWYIDDYSVE